MSRIGRKKIEVPANVKVQLKDRTITVQGPVGTLNLTFRPDIKVKWDEAEKAILVSIDPKDEENTLVNACWGTTRALIRNMIEGVTKGYEETMEVVGVGWTAQVAGPRLKLVIGYANPIMMDIPKDLKVTVEKSFVKFSGPDRRVVGQFAAQMRALRKPEPYNGKGIKYASEVIKKKAGKTFGA
jgi:large subunit ribosomal protein L6